MLKDDALLAYSKMRSFINKLLSSFIFHLPTKMIITGLVYSKMMSFMFKDDAFEQRDQVEGYLKVRFKPVFPSVFP